jgi:hypothetical protein
MNDLNALLERAAGQAGGPVDARTDLTRGRRALARTRRRRGAAGLAGVAAVGALGVGAAQWATGEGTVPVAETLEDDTHGPLQTVPVQAGPFSFDVTPAGWHVQGHRAGSVTFALDDGTSDPHPDAFIGKIVLLYDTERMFGDPVLRGDREFRVSEGGDATSAATRTRDGEPRGTVRLQVPEHLGWSVDDVLEMLDGVHVGEGAVAPELNPGATYEELPGGGYLIIGD